MVVLSRYSLHKKRNLGIIMFLVGIVITKLSFTIDIYNMAVVFICGFFLGIGLALTLFALLIGNRYKHFFENKSEVTIEEIANKVNEKKDSVISELILCVADRNDIKKLNSCEKVKFDN